MPSEMSEPSEVHAATVEAEVEKILARLRLILSD